MLHGAEVLRSTMLPDSSCTWFSITSTRLCQKNSCYWLRRAGRGWSRLQRPNTSCCRCSSTFGTWWTGRLRFASSLHPQWLSSSWTRKDRRLHRRGLLRIRFKRCSRTQTSRTGESIGWYDSDWLNINKLRSRASSNFMQPNPSKWQGLMVNLALQHEVN